MTRLVRTFQQEELSAMRCWHPQHGLPGRLAQEMLNESLAVTEKRRMVVESHAALRDLLATKKVSAQRAALGIQDPGVPWGILMAVSGHVPYYNLL